MLLLWRTRTGASGVPRARWRVPRRRQVSPCLPPGDSQPYSAPGCIWWRKLRLQRRCSAGNAPMLPVRQFVRAEPYGWRRAWSPWTAGCASAAKCAWWRVRWGPLRCGAAGRPSVSCARTVRKVRRVCRCALRKHLRWCVRKPCAPNWYAAERPDYARLLMRGPDSRSGCNAGCCLMCIERRIL
jgi:hypothetical protein